MPDEADVICALGGDGFMLQTLHRHGALGRPVYGMKLGTVGFLMNQHRPESLVERLHAAEPTVLRPLEMVATTESGATVASLATAVVFGALGFLFGKYALSETDLIQFFPELRAPDSIGSLTAWLVGLVGLVFGMRRGRQIGHRRERAERRRREREEMAQSGTDGDFPVVSSTRRR